MKRGKVIRLHAHAKINLYLDVVSKRTDGYHNLETVFHSIGLHDEVILRKRTPNKITISCDHPDVPSDHTNIAYRAAEAIGDAVDGYGGLEIHIIKRIPVAAGLAGGSANAAAVLLGVNELYGLELSKNKLMKIGAKLGADVPFCIQGGAAVGTGIGDKLNLLSPLTDVSLLIVNTGLAIPTAEVFNNLHIPLTKQENRSIIIRQCIEKGDLIGVGKNLYNIFEKQVFHKHPELAEIKTELTTQTGCYGALMSGSGSTLYAIMRDMSTAHQCKSHFNNIVSFCKITTTNSVGISIDN